MTPLDFEPKLRRIIRMVALGETNRTIAKKVGATEHMIKNYLRGVYDRIGMDTRLELALWYWRRNYETRTRHSA